MKSVRIAWLMIVLQLMPSYLEAANPVGSSLLDITRLGIICMNDLQGDLEKYYPLLERRLQRWLENVGSAKIKAERLSGSLSAFEIEQSRQYLELLKAETQLKNALMDGVASKEVQRIQEGVSSALKQNKVGYWANPQLQRVFVLLAQSYFVLGNLKVAASLLKKASALHPSGELVRFNEWDSEHAVGIAGKFLVFAEAVLAESRRTCAIKITAPSFGMKLYANGFPIDASTMFASRQLVRVWGELNGSRTDESLVRCDSTSEQSIVLSWGKGKSKEPFSIRTAEGGQFHTYLIVGGTKLNFRIFLFTPKKGIDEIPLEHPLTVRYLTDSNLSGTIPVSEVAIGGILEKHHLIASTESVGFPVGYHGQKGESQLVSENRSWYESPTFWVVVGGVLAGGAVVYLMNRNNSGVGSQGHQVNVKGTVE